jgi:hypothetical protein
VIGLQRKSHMLKNWWKRTTPARRAQLILGVLAGGIALALLIAPKPWQWDSPGDRPMRIADYVRLYSWWAGAANGLLAAAMAASARWWMRPSRGGLFRLPRPSFPRWFWPITIVAMLLCGWFGAHRLRQSFWDDEVYAMRRAIHGQWKRDDNGSIRFRPVSWQETLWFFDKPQHQLHSIITRIVLDTWRAVARPKGLKFREDVARIPSYLAGVLSVGSLALLLWRLGFPAAGVIAAFLLVIHPWHVRYASEMRAYSFMLCILPVSHVFLLEALNTGLWRWWSAYGTALFVLMYSNALNIYPAAGLGLCGLAAIVSRWRDPEARIQIGRFCVVTSIAAMIFLQLMLPCVPQFIEYQNTTAVQGKPDLRWVSSYLALLFAGVPWSSTGEAVSKYMELYPRAISHPLIFAVLVCLTIVLLVVGTRRLLIAGSLQCLVALSLLAPAPIALLLSIALEQHLFEWYLLFLLPGAVAMTALGLDSLRKILLRNTAGTAAGTLLVVGFLCGYLFFTTPQRTWLLNRPIQQIRESAEATRPVLDPFAEENKNIITASFIGPPDPYDANIIFFRSLSELAELTASADKQDKPLFINFGFLTTAQIRFRPILNALEDSSLFERTAELQGFDPINDRYVYRYRRGSSVGRDLVGEFQPESGDLMGNRSRDQ